MIDIVFSSDDGFVRQLLVASASAVYASRNSNDTLTVHVLDCGISDRKWEWYKKKLSETAEKCSVYIEVMRHVIDMRKFDKVPSWTNGSKATWARILLPHILSSVSTCIYSDCDVLFVENPSAMLDALKECGKMIMGHKNPFGNKSPDAIWFSEKGLPYSADEYFCAGLVALDLDAMRAMNIVDACWRFLEMYPDPVSVDQTVLNYVCAGGKGVLPDGWGLFTHECYGDDVDIKAIHFSGGWPWKKAKNAYDALCIHLSGKAVGVWRTFETNILCEPDFPKAEVPFIFRMEAMFVLWICRLLFRVGLVPSRLFCLLELVKSYGGSSARIERIEKSLRSARG